MSWHWADAEHTRPTMLSFSGGKERMSPTKLFVAVALSAIALVSVAHSQGVQLPGPGIAEWHVAMAKHSADANSNEPCVAVAHVNKNALSELYHIAPSKYFGPFPNEEAAESALQKAGWSYSMRLYTKEGVGTVWFASKGC